jgi:hypothetical protein
MGAAGACGLSRKRLPTIEFAPDVPVPRCIEALPGGRLRLVNRSGAYGMSPVPVTIRLAGFVASIPPNHAVILDEPLGRYLQPGGHSVMVSGAPGPAEVWIVGSGQTR